MGYPILTHTHLLGESMTWNKEYWTMHQQLDQWCWISSQSSNLSPNLQESRQKLSVASSSWPIANALKLRKQRYLFHPKERPPPQFPFNLQEENVCALHQGVQDLCLRLCEHRHEEHGSKNIRKCVLESFSICIPRSSKYPKNGRCTKIMEYNTIFLDTHRYIYIYIYTYIYIYKEVARSWSTLPHPHSAQQVGTKKIWDPWLPSRSLHLDPWSDNISSPWTDPQGLWDSKIRNGEPPRKLVNWIIIWHGWGLRSIFVQWHKQSCGFIVPPTTNNHMFESPFFYSNFI